MHWSGGTCAGSRTRRRCATVAQCGNVASGGRVPRRIPPLIAKAKSVLGTLLSRARIADGERDRERETFEQRRKHTQARSYTVEWLCAERACARASLPWQIAGKPGSHEASIEPRLPTATTQRIVEKLSITIDKCCGQRSGKKYMVIEVRRNTLSPPSVQSVIKIVMFFFFPLGRSNFVV